MFRTVFARRAACLLLPLLTVLATSCEDSPVAPVPVPEVHAVRVSPPQVTLRIDETAVLVADVEADSGADKNVIWSSADPRRVGVTATGIIMGMSAGTAVITAVSSADSTKRAFVSVNVLPGYGVQALSVTPTTMILDQGA